MIANPSLYFKHAFVTGATGIVGVPLCNKLSEWRVNVTAYSRSAGKFDMAPGAEHVQGDILDVETIAKAAIGADVIFHVAAAVHGSASSYSEFEAMNVLGTENMIRVARYVGAKLVHVSTVNVDGYREGLLTDAYAATKSRGEELVLEAVSSGDLDAVIVRPAAVFGNVPGRAGLIVDRLLSRSLKVLPAPSRMISGVWSGDLAVALIRAADSGETGKVYTVAGPAMSTREFVDSVCSAANLPAPRISIPGWAVVVPLQLMWWNRKVTRWTPPVTVEAVRNGSVHEGSQAASELGFSYTSIAKIFTGS